MTLVLEFLVWSAAAALWLTLLVGLWIAVLELRSRLRPRPRPPGLRCLCGAHPLFWEDAPLYQGGWLHEMGRCYPEAS